MIAKGANWYFSSSVTQYYMTRVMRKIQLPIVLFIVLASLFSYKNLLSQSLTDNQSEVKVFSGPSAKHAFAIIDGNLYAWGNNDKGQLGIGHTYPMNYPVMVLSDKYWYNIIMNKPQPYWVDIATSLYHTLGLKSDSTLWAWGSNGWSELGKKSKEKYFITPMQVGQDNDWAKISAATSRSFGIKKDNTLWQWGYHYNWQYKGYSAIAGYEPMPFLNANNWLTSSSTSELQYAIKNDGSLWVWGDNHRDYLKRELYNKIHYPVCIDTFGQWKSISAGQFGRCYGLKKDSTLWIFGRSNDKHEVVSTRNDKYFSKMQLGTDHDWVKIRAGSSTILGLKSNGTIWGYGNNHSLLMMKYYGSPTHPMQIGTDSNWVDIAAGNESHYAVNSYNQVFAWGKNSQGQLGNYTMGERSQKVQVLFDLDLPRQSISDQMIYNSRAYRYDIVQEYLKIEMADSNKHDYRRKEIANMIELLKNPDSLFPYSNYDSAVYVLYKEGYYRNHRVFNYDYEKYKVSNTKKLKPSVIKRILNLINNPLHYTPSHCGSPKVGSSVIFYNKGKNIATIIITDNGCELHFEPKNILTRGGIMDDWAYKRLVSDLKWNN